MGLRIDVDTSRGITNITNFRQSLKDTGAEAVLTEREVKALEARFERKLAADQAEAALAKARQRIEEVGKAAGLSEREIQGLADKAGVAAVKSAELEASSSTLGDTLGSLAIKIGATAAAYVSLRNATAFLSESATLAARYDTLGVVVHTVGENAGYATEELNGLEGSLQKTGISMNASRQSITQMIQANMDLANATKLARAAQDAAVIGGINSSEAFDRMTTALQTSQPEMLRTMGIVVNFDQAYRKFAQTLGTNADALTENQKMQARVNATMEATRTIAGAYEASMETAGKQALSMTRYLEDLKVNLGLAFQPAYKGFIEGATDAIKDFSETVKDPGFQSTVKSWAESLGSIAKAMAEIAKYSGVKSQIGTLMEGDKLRREGKVDAEWWKEFTSGDLMDFSGENSWNSLENAMKRQRMVAEATKRAMVEARDKSILSGQGVSSQSYGSGSAYTSDIPLPGELEKLFNAGRAKEAYDLQNSISLFLDKNKNYQSTASLLDDATKTWTGERAIADRAQTLAKAIGDTQMLTDAEKMQAEADQKLIETRYQLVRADDEVRRSIHDLAMTAASDQADLAGDQYLSQRIKIEQDFGNELAQHRDRMATYKGADKDALTAAGEYWINYRKGVELARTALEEWRDAMSAASDMLGELGRLSGDPAATYGSSMTTAQEWEAEQARRIGAIQDESERTKQLGELQQVMALKEVEARRQAYEGVSAVSSQYWTAERERIETHLGVVKKYAEDETAYKIYEAQQWDEYNKKLLEKQAAYSGSPPATLAADLALKWKTYESDITRAKERTHDLADSIAKTVDDLESSMSSALSAGITDFIFGLGEGKDAFQEFCDSMKSVFKNALNDMAKMFLDENIFDPLKKQIVNFIGGSSSGASPAAAGNYIDSAFTGATFTGAIFTGNVGTGGSGGSAEDVLAGMDKMGPQIGTSAGDSFFKSVTSTAGSSDGGLIIANTQGIESLIGSAASDLGSIVGKHESGGNYGTVSSGDKWGDPGGVSYGKYQFSSVAGTLNDFLKWSGYTDHPSTNTPDFQKWWKVQSESLDFQKAQEGYVQEKFYSPIITQLKDIGASVDNPGIQEMALAVANAHGVSGGSKIISRALGDDASSMSSIDVINAIYAERLKSSGENILDYWQKSTLSVQNSVKNRLISEKNEILGVANTPYQNPSEQSKLIGSSISDSLVEKLGSSNSDFSKALGQNVGSGFGDYLSTQTEAGMQFYAGKDNALAKTFSDGIDMSSLGFDSDHYNYVSTKAMASTYTGATDSKYNWGTATAGLGMAAGGVMGMLNAKTALGALGSGVMSAGGVMMMIPGLQVAGAITSAVGGIVSLFGQENKKEVRKIAEGYNIGYSGGSVSASGVDFYSDGSTVNTGVTDPAVVRKVSQAMEDAAERISDASKLLGFSTKDFVKNFSFPSMNVTGGQLDGLIANMTTAMAFTALDQAGLRGAVEAVAKKGETYDLTLERLGAAYQTVGGYTEAYGYDLQTLAGITQESIDALRETNTQVAQGTLPAMLTMAAAMGATGDIMSVLASTATDTSVALNVTDEQLSKILQADYASQIEEAVGGEDAFKTIMGNLVKNTLNSIDAYQKQAVYYTNKSNEAFADLKDPSVSIDNFWSSFDAAMKKGLSVDDFEAWADASSWVNNFQTITDAITDFYNTIEKLGQSLQARNYKALGMDTASSASTQIASNRWELYDAGKAGYDDATLAAITATQGAEVAKALQDVFDNAQSALDDAVGGSKVPSDLTTLRAKFDDLAEAARILGASEQDLADIRAKEQATIDAKLAGVLTSVSDQLDDATRTDTEKWYSSLHRSITQSIEDARALGASEQQLSDIRANEQTIIAAKLGDMMGDIREALSTYNGTELAYSVSSLKKEMAGKLYDAALLGASQADLTDVGTLYAYKVKAAYQTQIDTIVSQLKTAASALDTFSTSIKDFLDGLWTDSDVSPLTVTGQYAEAQSQWRKAAADLSSADEAVRSAAQDKIQGLTTTYLKDSQAANSSAAAYYADFAEVQTVLGDSYKQAKTDHDLLQAQLDAATGTEDHTKTTAELMDQLHSLQAQQGATWTQMMADLPKNIADALAEALGLKKTGASGGGAGGGGSWGSLSYRMGDGKGGWIDYGSADAWDAAYVAAEQSYLEAKAAELNAAGTDGKSNWNVYDVAKSISDLGLTPYEHFFQYGSGEKNVSTGEYLTWDNAPHTAAPRNLTTGGTDVSKYDVISPDLNIGSAFNESAYLSNKVDQLNATATGGRTNWTEADVTASLAGLGMTPAEHFAQYGQYEGVKPYATGGLVADLARSGGYLPGYSSVDDTLAMLKRGEFVFTQDAVRRWGPDTLNAMNSGNVRGFSDGGLVSPSPVSRPPYSGGSASSSSGGNNDAEVKALRQEVAELKEIVRGMARDMSQGLDRIVVNTTPQ